MTTTADTNTAVSTADAATSQNPTPVTGVTTTTGSSTPGGSVAAVLSALDGPPSSAHIPAPPPGFVPATGRTAKWLPPTTEEQNLLSAVALELTKFPNFVRVFGLLGVAQSDLVQSFNVTDQWTTMRNQSAAWDAYAVSQEKLGWTDVRESLKKMKPLITLAASTDPTLRSAFPNLLALLAVKSGTSAKGATTKRLNKAAVAAGKPASHGAAGKARQTKAAKALLLAAQAGATKQAPTPTVPASSPPPPTAPGAH